MKVLKNKRTFKAIYIFETTPFLAIVEYHRLSIRNLYHKVSVAIVFITLLCECAFPNSAIGTPTCKYDEST